MRYRHSFPQILVAGLTVVFLAGAQYACQADAPRQTDAEQQMDAGGAQGAAAGEVHWSYEGDTEPHLWGGLDSSFAACDSGVQQSPIDLTDAIPAGGGGLEIQWQPTAGEVVDNGHTIQVNIDAGSSITLEDRQFSLLQFHFHLPSEHTVEGARYPMEVHFVHQAEEGDLAVIGVFMDGGGGHSAVQSIWDAIPGVDQEPTPLASLDPNAFLPGGRSYFRYAGSLTTPPCSEVVSWVVLAECNCSFAGTGRCLRGPVSNERASAPAALSTVHSDEVARGVTVTRRSDLCTIFPRSSVRVPGPPVWKALSGGSGAE